MSSILRAWIIVGLGLFLVFSYPPTTLLAQETNDATVQSYWFGTLDAKLRMFRFYVTITENGDSVAGSLISLDEGSAEFPLSDVSLSDKTLQFKLPVTKAEFIGARTEDGKIALGKWKQAGTEFDLEFREVEKLPEDSPKAYWTGKLDAVIQKLDVAFREVDDSTVLFDSITQRVGGFVAEKSVDGTTVTFEVPMVRGTFTGTINDAGNEIVGKWKQGPSSLDLKLEKTEIVAQRPNVPQRPQNPVGPFPYEVEEFNVDNPQVPGVALAGTLTIPTSNLPCPAVVMISGSGPQDRDETIFDHKPFWVIADHLSRQGIAVLRFDDRGVGQSTGNFATANSLDFGSDVEALVAFLKQHPKIDASSIALCGHSEGGIIAPMVAAKDSSIAALVLLAAPAVTGERILLSQSKLLLEASKTAEEEITKQQKIQQTMLDLATREPALDRASFLEQAKKALEDTLANNELTVEEIDAVVAQAADQLLSPWFRFFLIYDPAETLTQVKCPTLAIYGGLDLQVDPKLNLPAIELAFADGGLQNYEVHVLSGLNHLFQTATTGSVSEYAESEETISPKVLETMSDWLRKTLAKE